MNLLLDTHLLLWAAAGELPDDAAAYIEDMNNSLYFSPASIWEVVIKHRLGRKDFDFDPHSLYNGLLEAGYKELYITSRHSLVISALPNLHKDPFDRLLIAQSIYEGIPLLTADKQVAQYPGPIILTTQRRHPT